MNDEIYTIDQARITGNVEEGEMIIISENTIPWYKQLIPLCFIVIYKSIIDFE